MIDDGNGLGSSLGFIALVLTFTGVDENGWVILLKNPWLAWKYTKSTDSPILRELKLRYCALRKSSVSSSRGPLPSATSAAL